jgi:hypothetical protein
MLIQWHQKFSNLLVYSCASAKSAEKRVFGFSRKLLSLDSKKEMISLSHLRVQKAKKVKKSLKSVKCRVYIQQARIARSGSYFRLSDSLS